MNPSVLLLHSTAQWRQMGDLLDRFPDGGPPVTVEFAIAPSEDRPPYLVMAGLEGAIAALFDLSVPAPLIARLRLRMGLARILDAGLGALLQRFVFRGSVWAVPEGAPVFAEEPLLSLRAPLVQAELLRPFLSVQLARSIQLSSLLAGLVDAAGPVPVIDDLSARLGLAEGAVLGRAAALAGITGTTSIATAARYGLALPEEEDELLARFSGPAQAPSLEGLRVVRDLDEVLGARYAVATSSPSAALRALCHSPHPPTAVLLERMPTALEQPLEITSRLNPDIGPGRPWRHQILRRVERRRIRDEVVPVDEADGGSPLLSLVMRNGELVDPWAGRGLEEWARAGRARLARERERLPAHLFGPGRGQVEVVYRSLGSAG